MRPKQVLTNWLRAIETRDNDKILGALADDIELRSAELQQPISGKETLRGLIATAPEAYESLSIEILKILESGDDAAALVRVKGKLRTDVTVLGETLKVAGKSFTATGALFARVNADGKIDVITRVRDNLEIARQLGISPQQMDSMYRKLDQQLAA